MPLEGLEILLRQKYEDLTQIGLNPNVNSFQDREEFGT